MMAEAEVTVGFAGLDHLGIVTAVGLAEKGFRVIAWDPDPERVGRLAAGDPIVSEPGLDELLFVNAVRTTFTTDLADLTNADMIYVAADVPTDDNGNSNLGVVTDLIGAVRDILSESALLVVLCQVPPGFTRGLGLPESRLFYQVETLVVGRAVERTLSPERFIIGCAQPSEPLPPALDVVLSSHGCPILQMRYESAELAKISINCFLVSQVSTTNMLAEICERIGANWSEIAPALQLDRRIGVHAYLRPGLGIAGGNLERDLASVAEISAREGIDAALVDACRRNSAWRKDWLYRVLEGTVLRDLEDPVIAILGLAYKENTGSIKNSPSIALLEQLEGRRTRIHDPVVPASVVPWAEHTQTALGACGGADAVVIATPWPEYRDLTAKGLDAAMRGRVLVDPFAVLTDACPLDHGFAWYRLGV